MQQNNDKKNVIIRLFVYYYFPIIGWYNYENSQKKSTREMLL